MHYELYLGKFLPFVKVSNYSKVNVNVKNVGNQGNRGSQVTVLCKTFSQLAELQLVTPTKQKGL